MYTATFTYAMRPVDDVFRALDARIAEAARAVPGYLGEESWENPTNGVIANVYYWETWEALQVLMQHPDHREAKRRHAEWLDGYHVVIAQVLASHGDGGVAHPLTAMGTIPLRSRTDPA